MSEFRKITSRLRKIVTPFFKSAERWRAWRFLITLITLSLTLSGAQVLMSYANRDMFTALSNKQEIPFYHATLWYVGWICIAVLLGVFYRFCEERFALAWRDWLTNHLVKRYFFRRAYYHLRSHEEIDNPDQRIAEDVKNITATTLSLGLIALNSIITLIAFLGVLWSISVPLVTVLVIYATVGTILTIFIGHRLVGINFRQYQKEATLRYGLVRVRDNAESIAFFRGEARERIDIMQRLKNVVNNSIELIGWNRNLAFFTSSYNYIALIVPLVVVAPLFLKGKVEFGVITQATGAFAQVLAALSLFIQQFERLSAYAAGVSRLGELWDAIAGDETEEDDDPEIVVEEGSSLVLQDLSVNPPGSDRQLINSLSLQLPKGKSLLIMGASGSGKSSILRTIAGLWNFGAGSIQRPQLKSMIFLPQKPYLIQGSLRANLLYPQRDANIEDDVLNKVLEKVNLKSILDRVHGDYEMVLDWSNILSLGEQQRLSFARLLLYKPSLAFLDEASSALDEENEKILYGLLKELKCSFVSVGHRSTLIAYHQFILTIKEDAQWDLEKCAA